MIYVLLMYEAIKQWYDITVSLRNGCFKQPILLRLHTFLQFSVKVMSTGHRAAISHFLTKQYLLDLIINYHLVTWLDFF